MGFSQLMRVRGAMVAAMSVACLAVITQQAQAYVDLAPTLGKVLQTAPHVAIVEVVDVDKQACTVTLKEIKSLKGELNSTPIVHRVALEKGMIPRQVIQWGKKGAQGVMFASATTALVCYGHGWYEVSRSKGAWAMQRDRPDLPLAYHGSVPTLAQAVELMLAGKSAVITVVAHGADDEAASFDLALNRQNLPDMARVERLRADTNMPGNAMGVGNNPAYYMGTGAVDETDIPALVEKLKSPDVETRAAAAEDLQKLGKKAKPATEALAALLKDPSPHVQFEAAAALLQINPKDTSRVDVIAKGLGSSDASVRASAAEAAGEAGAPAGVLAEKLGALLKDPDDTVKINALLSITVLGQAAAKAQPAVQALLDDPQWQIDAADALGRMGSAAQPALPKLATMLSSEQYDVRWAAVRAMSQIGGEGAKPAVKFIIDVYQKGATEVEGYNSMVYLALLGPVAAEALPTIQNTRIKNPALPGATTWAIQADKYLPWQAGGGGGGGMGGGMGGRGGRGGFGGPGGGPGGIGGIIMQNYIKELGSRLAPTAKLLAAKILDGTAGDFPLYGYEILANNPETALPILTPKLQDGDLAVRERAAVAIGYMGNEGAPAKSALETAVGKASNEREKRLMQWAVRQVEKE